MLNFSRLLADAESYGDSLRYVHGSRSQQHGTAPGQGPVVVWNVTNTCNLECIHCYADAQLGQLKNELTTEEAKKVIDDLAAFNVPVILWSGGEPLMREDLFELIEHANSYGIRSTLSTNGTMITKPMAEKIKAANVSYVGISLDGPKEVHDHFRGQKGAFESTMKGLKNCQEIGQKVGLRLTLSKYTANHLEEIFDIIEEYEVPRACFYHLVYSGRGRGLQDATVTNEETRKAVDLLMRKAMEFKEKGIHKEILSVDNHADGPYLYLRTLELWPEKAEQVYELLHRNGGNRTGIAVANIDWLGSVHPDQFTMTHPLGNVREKPFSEIWTDDSNPILNGLRNRKEHLQGRCSNCKWFSICNGNFRARAYGATGDFWAEDPGCYLTDAEITE